MVNLLISLFKGMTLFTGSYSLEVFPEPLSKEEETKAIRAMEEGDREARNTLIERNLRLVAHIVKKFDTKETDADDLISIGTIGLIKGIDTYNSSKSTRLATYAARCIQNEILMYFRANKKYASDVSLNDSIGYDKEGNEINLIEVLNDKSEDIADAVHLEEEIKKLQKNLAVLNDREREIIEKRYGLNGREAMTQKDISKNMHISRSYVSRIEKRALTKLLKEFLDN